MHATRLQPVARPALVAAVVVIALAAAWLGNRAGAIGDDESTFVPITPVRILDTRDPVDVGLAGPFVSPVPQDLQVTGSVATTTGTQVVVPEGATGVVMNVTAVSPTAAGFVSIRPAGTPGAPATSSLNVEPGDIVPNAVTVSLPTTGAHAGRIEISFDAFGTPGPTTDLLIDVVGYHLREGLHDLAARVAALEAALDTALDTGDGLGPVTVSYGPGAWMKNTDFEVNDLWHQTFQTTASADGTVFAPLIAPTAFGTDAYTLAEVEYCIRGLAGGAQVTGATIHGFGGTSNAIAHDPTIRSAVGCYTVTPNAFVRDLDAFHLTLTLGNGVNVQLGNVIATFEPR